MKVNLFRLKQNETKLLYPGTSYRVNFLLNVKTSEGFLFLRRDKIAVISFARKVAKYGFLFRSCATF